MIKETNTRIQITLSKAQAEWLNRITKKSRVSASKYISWILSKKAEEMIRIMKFRSEFGNYSENEIIEILKTNIWDN